MSNVPNRHFPCNDQHKHVYTTFAYIRRIALKRNAMCPKEIRGAASSDLTVDSDEDYVCMQESCTCKVDRPLLISCNTQSDGGKSAAYQLAGFLCQLSCQTCPYQTCSFHCYQYFPSGAVCASAVFL